MEKSSKQFEALATKWKTQLKSDGFIFIRLKLTFYYFITATVILLGSSLVLYNTLFSRISDSVNENIPNPFVAQTILDRTQDILKTRFITIDVTILFFVVIIGFFLTQKTLQPINVSMQKQKRFIADASHELRTPIAVVISGLEVALRNKHLDIHTAKDVLQKSLDEMREFSILSNSLLDISKYDNSKAINHDRIVMSSLLKPIISKMQMLAKNKDVSLNEELKNEVTVEGDALLLGRVFFNVLDNAITHTPAGGTITILDNINGNNYVVKIKDTGVGIDKGLQKRVFDPFIQGDASRNTNGAGLGLTIAKKIIESHKGSISIESELGKGTEVSITLPIVPIIIG